MTLTDLMQTLAEGLGAALPEFDPEEGVEIGIDDDVAIWIAAAPESASIQLVASIAPLPGDADAALMRRLLEGNHMGAATGGAAISIDAEASEIALNRTILQDELPLQAFDRELVSFVAAVRHCRTVLMNEPAKEGSQEHRDAGIPQSGLQV